MTTSPPCSRCAAGVGLVELERRLDPMLRCERPDDRTEAALRKGLQEWSAAVWATAEALGPSPAARVDLEQGLELAQRPVFVCGAARSGTTLLRDLLDGHPQTVALPNESGFYRTVERTLFGLRPDRHCAYLGRRWIERLAARPPFWLLGSSTEAASPYVSFARDYAAWCRVSETCREARMASWPLAAFALAYGQRLGAGRLPAGARVWVEKTPGNERCMQQIWRDFPKAKVIHLVRQPEAVLASVKRMTSRQWTGRRKLTHILGEMAPSYWIAAAKSRLVSDERYLLLRYEDLTTEPAAVMRQLANFLEIDRSPALLEPTVAGRPASNNTSFAGSRPAPGEVLDAVDRTLLALAVNRKAAKLGYVTVASSPCPRHSIVGCSQ